MELLKECSDLVQ